MKQYMHWVCSHAITVLLTVVALTLVASYFALQVKLEPSVQGMTARDSEATALYHKTTADFGSDRVTTVFIRDADLFSPRRLADLEEVAFQLEAVPGVDRVESIFTAETISNSEGLLSTGPLVDLLPETREEAAAIRAAIRSNPLINNRLVSSDGTAMAINLYFTPDPENPDFYGEFVDAIEALITPYESGFDTIFQIGNPYLRKVIGDYLVKDQLYLSLLSLAVLVTMLAITTRSLTGAVLPVISAGISVLWTIGFMGATGIPLNMLTIIVPSLIIAIGSTEDTHLLSEYFCGIDQHSGNRSMAVRFMISRLGIVVFFTALTTFLGFLSVCVNSIVILRQFGIVSAFGMLVNPVVTATIVPLYLDHWGPSTPSASRADNGNRLAAAIDRTADRLSGLVRRYRVWVLCLTGFLTMLFMLAGSKVSLNNDITSVFKKDSTVSRRLAEMNRSLPGVQTFYLVISGGHPDVFKQPENLRQIETLQAYIDAHPQFDTSLSLVDYLNFINREIEGGKNRAYALPDSSERVSQCLVFLEDNEVSRFVTSDFSTVTLFVRHNMSASHQQQEALADITAFIEKNLSPYFKHYMTGELILFMKSADDIANGQVTSIALILFIIFVIMSILFVNIKAGLISLVPNLFPIAVNFGLMGILDIPLNIGTAMVAAIAIGISVDDTIHFMTRYNQEMMSTRDQEEAMTRCIRHEIRPVLATSLALSCGFCVYLFSQFATINQFGFLSAVVILSAVVADLTMTPALLCSTKLLTLWDVITLHIRKEIVERSEFFRDLSVSQIKRIVLMGRIRNAGAGDTIYHEWDQGDSMYLILAGSVRTFGVNEETGEEVGYAVLLPGDVFGQTAMLDPSPRSMTARANADLTYVAFSRSDFERLQSWYPRIAARVYRNLARILGHHLALTYQKYKHRFFWSPP